MSEQDTVRIGCSISLSGEEELHGLHMLVAIRLAVQQAAERGDLPCALELLVRDDEGSAAGAEEAARDFVIDKSVVGVIGPLTSETVLASAPVYHRGRLAHISPAASTPLATRSGYDTFFRTVSNDTVQGHEAARLAVQYLGYSAIAIVHDGSAFGQPLAEVFRDHCVALGARIVLVETVAKGQTDFAAAIAHLAQARPELIYCGLIEAEGSRFAAQLRRAGVATPLFGADALKPSRFLEAPGMAVAGPFYTSASTDITRAESAAAFHSAYGNYSIYTAEAYDAAGILIEAIRRRPGRDREQVRAQVAATQGYPGASGVITFDAHGDLVEPHLDFYRVDDGALRFVGATRDLAARD
jgi:branched-chain amino acid transport system substrate-binding protein